MNKPYHIFGELIESEALQQFDGAMALDSSVAGALMPDAHKGYSLPIGGVVATDGMIYPSWVGYDIGCGMCAAPLVGVTKEDIENNREDIFKAIYKYVPVGKNHRDEPVDYISFEIMHHDPSEIMFELWNAKNPMTQIGTLGGGNHFIEIGVDEKDGVWVIIHSGSRNFGWKTAQAYMKLAAGGGKAREGNYGFAIDSEEGLMYHNDMNIALEFALENRMTILLEVRTAVESVVGKCDVAHVINRNHNHAEIKNHPDFGNVIIHRKGATHAEMGMMGVIPGNMRDGSFIVKGLGNQNALWSSSHGAGRVLGRKKAKDTLHVEDFEIAMEGISAKVDESTLDESPFAYKDIFKVMELQSDLVEVVHYVKPLINVKG